MPSAQKQGQPPRQKTKSRGGPTRLAAVLLILVALPILGSGMRFVAIELEAFGSQRAAEQSFAGRVLTHDEEVHMRAQLVKAASARPTRPRMEWASDGYAKTGRDLTEAEQEVAIQFLTGQLARNPASHPAWARLSRLERQRHNNSASARYYKAAYETGAYTPSSAIWAIAMGQRNWIYLDEETQGDVQQLTYDLFSFAPAATSTIAGPKWRELHIRAALRQEPEKIRLFERYLTLYFDPAYNR